MSDLGPYVGRSIELAAIRRAFARVLDGDPRVVVVSAESGYGKTRLIDEFARSVDAKSVVMLSVAVADHGEGGGRETELSGSASRPLHRAPANHRSPFPARSSSGS